MNSLGIACVHAMEKRGVKGCILEHIIIQEVVYQVSQLGSYVWVVERRHGSL